MINPSEISDILKQELNDVKSKVSFEEVGTVLEVGDGVAHVYGLENVQANELVEFENGVTGVAMNLEESNVGVILLDEVNSINENMQVLDTNGQVMEGLFCVGSDSAGVLFSEKKPYVTFGGANNGWALTSAYVGGQIIADMVNGK